MKERLADELYGRVAAKDLVIKERKENLHAIVRGQVHRELADNYAELRAREDETAEREANMTARAGEASPSYRAAFAAAGASVVLAADVLLRVVA